MKKSLLLLSLLALSISATAQTKFGVKGGINVSNFTGDLPNSRSKIGFYAGGYATIKIDDKFAFQPELLYSAQGAKLKSVSANIPQYGNVLADLQFNLSYINIPLMFKYYTSEGLSIEAGPQIGLLVSAKADVIDRKININDAFKSADFGLNVGLGYELPNGVNFGARYSFGLTDINENYGKVSNSVFYLGLGYSFK